MRSDMRSDGGAIPCDLRGVQSNAVGVRGLVHGRGGVQFGWRFMNRGGHGSVLSGGSVGGRGSACGQELHVGAIPSEVVVRITNEL